MADNLTLTGVAAEIEDLIGTELTLKLLAQRGGTRIVVPMKAAGSVLADIVGEEAADVIIDEFGTGPIVLPNANFRGMRARRARGYEMLRRGASLQEVALEIGCHTRTVGNWKREMRERGEELPTKGEQLRLPFG